MTKYLNDHLMIFVIVLCIAWFLVVAFHLYIRCYGRHISPSTVAGSTHLRHVVRSSDAGRGLDPSVVSALPTFVYDPKTEEAPLECAVCLSEFEGGESGRVMPDCSHRFHTECIDMWLMSHQDCPLCRTRVKVAGGGAAPVEDSQEGSVSITIHGSGTVWRSGLHVYFLSG